MKEPSSVKDELEFWRWREYNRIVEGKEWKSKDLITAGVDVGSVGSKAAIMVNGEAYSWGITRTGSNSPESATKVLGLASAGHGSESTATSNTSSAQGTGALTFPWRTKPSPKSPATRKAQTTFGDQACEPCLT